MALRPQAVLFGDSITQRSFSDSGWGASLVNYYARKADVVLRGYSGYNTRWALYLLNKILPIPSSSPPLFVTVFFGANDSALPDRASKNQHVPISEYKANLHKIVGHLKEVKAKHIILITPPPVSISGRQAYARTTYGDKTEVLPERTNEAAGAYAEACVSVAQELGVKALNIWSIFQEIPNWQENLLCDGLHFSPEGNKKLFEELVKILEDPSLSPSLKWDTLPWDFPEYDEIDHEDPSQTFGPLDSSSIQEILPRYG